MNYPVKKVYITQPFGVNEDKYKKFGFLGHNGIDFRLFDEKGNRSTTCFVFAPHDGKVIERRNDTDGYGNYLKIENDIEGSVLAHLKEFKVNLGKYVQKGELVAIGDNTGWSTGAHLHHGYYRKPRDRNNGYGGFIDQTPFIGENNSSMVIPTWLRTMFLELGIDLEKPENEIRNKIQEVIDGWKKYEKLIDDKELLQKELALAKGEAAEAEERLRISERNRGELKDELEGTKKIIANRDSEISQLKTMVEGYQDKVCITEENYQRLTETKVLDRFKWHQLIGELLRRILKRK